VSADDRKATSRTAFVFTGRGSLGAVQVDMLKALVMRGEAFAGDPSAAGVANLEELWRCIRRRDVFPIAPVACLFGLLAGRDYVVNAEALENLLERYLP
jgi:NTE family protein